MRAARVVKPGPGCAERVEKAHPDVMELFYQVFDKGILEDGEGVTVDFKHTVILLTSIGEWAPPTILAQGARLVARQRAFNLVVTNVPGPQIPLYTLGVFLAFTLSQGGMLVRWWRRREPGWRQGLAINGLGTSFRAPGLVANSARFTTTAHDGPNALQVFGYVETCTCIRYRGNPLRAPR